MTSLEYIEKEIEDRKENIKHWEKQLERYPNSDVFTRCINMCNEQLQILQRIKTILEIWDIIKVELNIKVIERHRGIFSSMYALECTYEDVIPILDEEFESFKKALEVEDE